LNSVLFQKISKKSLTSFLGGGIELKNFNLFVSVFHKIHGEGGEGGKEVGLMSVVVNSVFGFKV
jgi:hypothetical protein